MTNAPLPPVGYRTTEAGGRHPNHAHLAGVPAGKAAVITKSGVKYIDRADAPAEESIEAKPKRPRNSQPRAKNDPKYVKAARELRDRYLEQVNADRMLPAAQGKYDVSRQLAAAPSAVEHSRLLDAA